jgi:mono/diheme cytochrome c family protein
VPHAAPGWRYLDKCVITGVTSMMFSKNATFSKNTFAVSVAMGLALMTASTSAFSQDFASRGVRDPGVRGGPAGGGAPISAADGLNENELKQFNEGKFRATELEATCETCSQIVPGTMSGESPFLNTITNSAGLGARFNGDQCSVCHSQPDIGGSGGFFVPNPVEAKRDPSKALPPENPMFRLIPHRHGETNKTPPFITQYGPIREMRLKFKPDGTRDGGVHQLFTVVGRDDDPGNAGCSIKQPDFATELANNNASFRIPLQLFGLGLIDTIEDQEIIRRHDASASYRARFGVVGRTNRSDNDGTITRFGWKAQNKSLTVFAGEAYNVEMGVTNELFPQATDETDNCNVQKPHPNDVARTANNDLTNESFFNPIHIFADWMQFTFWMRFLDAPKPVALTAQAQRGKQVFTDAGCAACHTPQMVTAGTTQSPSVEGKTANLYSDLLIHHMGANLADNVIQGQAGVDEFRTQPLWGVGQRLFFMHDGRTNDLVQAIREHVSPATPANPRTKLPALPASEANLSVFSYFAKNPADQQALLVFLRSL